MNTRPLSDTRRRSWPSPLFRDRAHAGQTIATRLIELAAERPVVVALPRGGVPVAAPVAEALDAPLYTLKVRKIRAPDRPELALGAVVDLDEPIVVLNPAIVEALEIGERTLRREIETQRALLARSPFDPWSRDLPISGRCVVLIDDGLATGASARAALTALRQGGAARRILAVPLAPVETLAALRPLCEALVCPAPIHDFVAVGCYYQSFPQVSEGEALKILHLREAARRSRTPG